ncbi:terminase, partial [Clostridium botulinum]|nr:terminase [Clostridium botulinum]
MIYFDNLKFDTELKYEVYLLNKYLTKHYNSKTSKALLEANNNNLDELARALGEIDIEFFCLYFMSDTFVVKDSNVARQLSKGHYELWDIANDIFIKDKHDKAAIIEPRGFA